MLVLFPGPGADSALPGTKDPNEPQTVEQLMRHRTGIRGLNPALYTAAD